LLIVIRSGEPDEPAEHSRASPCLCAHSCFRSERSRRRYQRSLLIFRSRTRELPSVTVWAHNRRVLTARRLLFIGRAIASRSARSGRWLAQRPGQPWRPHGSRRREPASVRHQRPAVTHLTDGLRRREARSAQPRRALPRSTRNLPVIGHLQQHLPILRITARQWRRVRRGFLLFPNGPWLLPRRTRLRVPGPP